MRRREVAFLAVLAGVLLTGPAVAPPGPAGPGTLLVVALGDSVPAGDACDCTPFPNLVATDLAAVHGRRPLVLNLAVGGATALDVRQDALVAQPELATAGVVLITVGANDVAPLIEETSGDGTGAAGTSPDAADVRTALDQATAHVDELLDAVPPGRADRQVLVTGYWAVGLDGAVARSTYTEAQRRTQRRLTAALDRRLRQDAADHGAHYLDLRPVFHGVSGHADPTSLLATDGDHPDAAGHRAIAHAVVRVLLR